MGMDQNQIKDILKELSSSSGGSLVKKIKKHNLAFNSNVLFVGLGGLGSKTINEIKGIYNREFEYTDRIDFLAVDTCKEDQSKLTIGLSNSGNLDASELFQIYDINAKYLLMDPPQEVKNWLGNITPREIHPDGAQGVRQIGRIMLCGTSKYTGLKQIIKSKIDDLMSLNAAKATLQVVIIAGISGGTGSGTFIDVSYMIQDCLSEYKKETTNMWGVFYTPDVQKSVPEIGDNPAIWSRVQKNGYAAFKELDYFVSSGSKEKNAPIIYKLQTPEVEIKSSKPIFDRGKVFVVSQSQALTREKQIVESTSKSIINMFRSVDTKDGAQSILSAYSNFGVDLQTWDNLHIGKENVGTERDLLGIKNTEFPSFMNYNYTSFGYSAIYFPRDEMMSYCANMVMTKVYDEWNKHEVVSQDFVDKIFNKYLKSSDYIIGKIKDKLKVNVSSFRIDKNKDAGSWPIVKKILGVGTVSGLESTMNRAESKVDDALISISNQNKGTLLDIVNGLANPIIDLLSDPEFVSKCGPFSAIAVIMGIKDKNIVGCLDKIKLLIKQNDKVLENKKKNKEAKFDEMTNAADTLSKDHLPSDTDIDVFIDSCYNYSVAYYEYKLFEELFVNVLKGIGIKLKEFNNDTYDIYVPIIETLTKTLNRDADIFADSSQQVQIQGNDVIRTFGMDAFGITKSAQKKQRFISMFSDYVDKKKTEQLAKSFSDSMFDASNRGKWSKIKDDPEWLIGEVRRLFNNFFTPFVDNMLEKFIVLAYAPASNNKLTIQDLTRIWNADDGTPDASIRDTAIANAANEIVSEFINSGSLLMQINGTNSTVNKLQKYDSFILLEETPKVNKEIIDNLKGRGLNDDAVGYISSEEKSVIFRVTYAAPVALPQIYGFDDYAQNYFDSEATNDTEAGRHLDEKGQNWVEYLPEIYGIDAEEYYHDNEDMRIAHLYDVVENTNMSNDKYLYDKISKAIDYCKERGVLSYDSKEKAYVLLTDIKSDDGFESFRRVFGDLYSKNRNISIKECLDKEGSEYYHTSYEPLKIFNPSGNSFLNSNQNIESDNKKRISILARIIRGRMDFIEKLFSTQKTLEESDFYDIIIAEKNNIDNEDVYNQKLILFSEMLMCDLISSDENEQVWKYRLDNKSTYSDLCRLTLPKNELDSLAYLYLVFTRGIWELKDEEKIKYMNSKINSYFENQEYDIRKDYIDKIKVILDNQLLKEVYINSIKTSEYIEKLYKTSKYKDYYNLPNKVENGITIIDNLKSFYNDLLGMLDKIK